MEVFSSLPRSFIKQLCICLKPTCFGRISISHFHMVVELAVLNSKFLNSIWLWSLGRFQICFSERSAPFFVKSFMVSKLSSVSITSELVWSCFVKVLLVSFKINGFPFSCSFLKFIFFLEASTSYFCVWSSKLRVTAFAWDESCVFWNSWIFWSTWWL